MLFCGQGLWWSWNEAATVLLRRHSKAQVQVATMSVVRSRAPRLIRLLIVALVLANIPMALYFGNLHQRGTRTLTQLNVDSLLIWCLYRIRNDRCDELHSSSAIELNRIDRVPDAMSCDTILLAHPSSSTDALSRLFTCSRSTSRCCYC